MIPPCLANRQLILMAKEHAGRLANSVQLSDSCAKVRGRILRICSQMRHFHTGSISPLRANPSIGRQTMDKLASFYSQPSPVELTHSRRSYRQMKTAVPDVPPAHLAALGPCVLGRWPVGSDWATIFYVSERRLSAKLTEFCHFYRQQSTCFPESLAVRGYRIREFCNQKPGCTLVHRDQNSNSVRRIDLRLSMSARAGRRIGNLAVPSLAPSLLARYPKHRVADRLDLVGTCSSDMQTNCPKTSPCPNGPNCGRMMGLPNIS
jgi:hypothetical protein